MSAKMAAPSLLKIKVFWNKGYYVIDSVCDVTNKIPSHDSNYIVDVVMWPKFGNSSNWPFCLGVTFHFHIVESYIKYGTCMHLGKKSLRFKCRYERDQFYLADFMFSLVEIFQSLSLAHFVSMYRFELCHTTGVFLYPLTTSENKGWV